MMDKYHLRAQENLALRSIAQRQGLSVSTGLIDFRQECRIRWRSGTWLEHNQTASTQEMEHSLPWIPYESYMKAQIVQGIPGELGLLLVQFPAEASEGNAHHCHPKSDRCITVIKGSGTFECFKRRQFLRLALSSGDRVWMPRGVLHTFRSGADGLLVESLHNPFLAFNNPHCLVYPK